MCIHVWTHTSDIRCKWCGHLYPNLRSLHEHSKLHDKRSTCIYTTCEKSFATEHSLWIHIKGKHSEGYSCAYGAVFSSPSQRLHHNKKCQKKLWMSYFCTRDSRGCILSIFLSMVFLYFYRDMQLFCAKDNSSYVNFLFYYHFVLWITWFECVQGWTCRLCVGDNTCTLVYSPNYYFSVGDNISNKRQVWFRPANWKKVETQEVSFSNVW